MYQVWIRQGWDGAETLVHSSHGGELKLVSPVVSLDTKAVDSFEFWIYPDNPGYNQLNYLTTFIRVYDTHLKQNIFDGRVLQPTKDMDTDGTMYQDIMCEALEGFLHDSTSSFIEFTNKSAGDIFSSLITDHNGQVEAYKQLKVGTVDVPTTPIAYCYTDDSVDTFTNLQNLLPDYEFRVRHESDGLYIDLSTAFGEQGSQSIEITKNITQITQSVDPTALVTVAKPIGATIESSSDSSTADKGMPRLTISSVNGGSPYLVDQALVDEFGRITKSVAFDQDTDPKVLMQHGKQFLATQTVAKIQLQVSVIDLNFIGKAPDELLRGNTYPVSALPLGLSGNWRIIQQTIDLMQPANNTVTMGDRVIGQEAYNQSKDTEIKALQHKVSVAQATANGAINIVASNTANTGLSVSAGKSALQINYTISLSAPIGATSYTIGASTDGGKTWSLSYPDMADSGTLTMKSYGTYTIRAQAVFGSYDAGWTGAQTITLAAPKTSYGDSNGAIIDVSEWQKTIDWSSVVKAGLSVAIIRVQAGTSHEDLTYKANIAGAIAAGANYAVYAYFNAISAADAKTEADSFYSRAEGAIGSNRQPVFWAIDVEANSVTSGTLSAAVSAYMNELNAKGIPDSKIVLYISESLYSSVDTARAGAIWMPAYGSDDGTVQTSYEPKQAHDLWQYTSKGSVSGISGNVDMSTHADAKMRALINN